MLNLIKKEFILAIHPTNLIFLSFSAMVLIPGYPFYVIFFYTGLALFFTCLNGRENNDVFYTMMLPVAKRDIVKARLFFAIIIEILQILLTIPFIIIRQKLMGNPNLVGMDANIAFLGLSLIMLGIFNMLFFTKYYKDVNKVGTAFIISSTVVLIYIIILEAFVHIIPLFRDYLDTSDNMYLNYKLPVLAIGIIIYVVLDYITYKKSANSFEKQDL